MSESKTVKKVLLYAVYGSLRHGLGNHRVIEDAKYLGEDVTPPEYNMYSLGAFPGVTQGGDTSITLEIYKVENPEIEYALDRLEGYAGKNNPRNFYNKELINTSYGLAYIYFLNDKDYKPTTIVESGDWVEYLKDRKIEQRQPM